MSTKKVLDLSLDTISFYAFEDRQKSIEDYKNCRFNSAIMCNALFTLQVNGYIKVFSGESMRFLKKALDSNNRSDLARFVGYFGKNYNDHFNIDNLVFEKVYNKGVILKDVLKVTFKNVNNVEFEALALLNSVTVADDNGKPLKLTRCPANKPESK